MREPPPPNLEGFFRGQGKSWPPQDQRARESQVSIHAPINFQLRHDMECIPADVSVGQLPYKASGHFQF